MQPSKTFKIPRFSKILFLLTFLLFTSQLTFANLEGPMIALTAQEQYEKQLMEQVEKNADDALKRLDANKDKIKAEYYAKVEKEEFLKEAEARRQQSIATLDAITKDYIECGDADDCYRKMFMAHLWQEAKDNVYLFLTEVIFFIGALTFYIIWRRKKI